jgi:hypothetical protein
VSKADASRMALLKCRLLPALLQELLHQPAAGGNVPEHLVLRLVDGLSHGQQSKGPILEDQDHFITRT